MPRTKEIRVAVIGAGISGIIAAIEFKRQLGIDVKIFERNKGPGGTWFVNVYPGCACDVPSHWYSLSTELNPDWSSTYSTQPEIQAYWERIFRKHNIGKQTHFGANFLRADWNTERQTYLIQFEDVTNPSDNFTFEAEVLISAIGGFSTPLIRPTGLPGIERFQGTCFHSARWDYNVDLEGKRVAVIGNGCSACQFIPKISQVTTTHVINFSRTPSWFVPRADKPFSSLQKNIFRYIPFYMKLYRAILVAESDFRWPVWVMKNKGFRRIAEQISTKHIKSVAPGKYHDFLLPKYPIGCKRIIVDPGYLQSLNQPNVELIYDPIKEITTSGVLCASGKEHEVDVLILATGFDLGTTGFGMNVYGSAGRSISEQWDMQNGPQAYLGTTLSNFPNYFTLLGPNVATGHTSAIAHIECQINYVIKMVKPMQTHAVNSFELRPKAEDDYNRWLHAKLDKTVWQGGCRSYYQADSGKIIAMWPGTWMYFWWRTHNPNFEHYLQKGGTATVSEVHKQKRAVTVLAILLCLGMVTLRWFNTRM